MRKRYQFIDERKFRFICEGLTLEARDIEVLDGALVALDQRFHIPSRIVEHNKKEAFGPPFITQGPQVIVVLDKMASPEKGPISMTTVIKYKEMLNAAPMVHINLQSPTLDIPQRVEIPLRFVLKGLPSFEETYMVYQHVLVLEDGRNLLYYGITRRGWMKRFNEHMTNAMRDSSPLLFHRSLRESIAGRLVQKYGAGAATGSDEEVPKKVLVGNHHVLCGAGLSKDQALDTEEYLVAKRSFGHADGLNMIPGGKAGIAYLHKLKVIPQKQVVVEDQDKERVLGDYLQAHPRKGVSNTLIAQRWLDEDYATRVICGGTGRLSPEQIRLIREAALKGHDVADIKQMIDASSERQVKHVVEGKTYTRIR